MGLRSPSTHSEGEIHGHSVRWVYRSRQDCLCRSRCERRREARTRSTDGGACQVGGTDRLATMRDRHGSVLRRALPDGPLPMSSTAGKPAAPAASNDYKAINAELQELRNWEAQRLPQSIVQAHLPSFTTVFAGGDRT